MDPSVWEHGASCHPVVEGTQLCKQFAVFDPSTGALSSHDESSFPAVSSWALKSQ